MQRSRFWALLVGAFLYLSTPAMALVIITNNQGGDVDAFINRYEIMRAAKEHVKVTGQCASACTLIASILPARNVCLTDAASFGFHSAFYWLPWDPDSRHFAKDATEAIFQSYPKKLQALLHSRGWDGGEHPAVMWVTARDIRAATGFNRCP